MDEETYHSLIAWIDSLRAQSPLDTPRTNARQAIPKARTTLKGKHLHRVCHGYQKPLDLSRGVLSVARYISRVLFRDDLHQRGMTISLRRLLPTGFSTLPAPPGMFRGTGPVLKAV